VEPLQLSLMGGQVGRQQPERLRRIERPGDGMTEYPSAKPGGVEATHERVEGAVLGVPSFAQHLE
jgi:hypothetical protein